MSGKAVDNSARYARTMEPMTVRGVTFKNRVFLASMGLDMAQANGQMSTQLTGFYRGIMDGGVGGIVLSNASVSPNSALLPDALQLFRDDHTDALRPLLQEGRARDVVIGVQLQHYGGQGLTLCTPTDVLLTPSGIGNTSLKPAGSSFEFKEMNQVDIDTVIGEFAAAAARAKEAGAQFVQLQGSNGYLLSSFLSKATNQREDDYGGSPYKRAKFVVDVVRAVRQALGEDIALGLRLQLNDMMGPKGVLPEDIYPIIPALERAGVDIFEVSFCVAETFGAMSTPASDGKRMIAEQVKAFRAHTMRPVGYAGFIGSLADGCRLIEEGIVDYIPMARALLADNDLVTKELSGNEDAVHRCRWDGLCFKDKFNPKLDRVHCCVNPKYLRPVEHVAAQ
jgi:2,4-dienoyl-CoA reductase-like NADH-dependent reductase (Old Yellow Enzyme family)